MPRMTVLLILCAVILFCWVAAMPGHVVAQTVTINQSDDRLGVLIDGELFTEYIFRGHSRPRILYQDLHASGTQAFSTNSDATTVIHRLYGIVYQVTQHHHEMIPYNKCFRKIILTMGFNRYVMQGRFTADPLQGLLDCVRD